MQSPISGFQMILMFVRFNYNLLFDIADPYPLFLETVLHELVRKTQVVKVKNSNLFVCFCVQYTHMKVNSKEHIF